MSFRTVGFLALAAVAGCRDAPAPRAIAVNPIRDSIRTRSLERFAERPDSVLARVDTGRILGAPTARQWVVFVGELQCAKCASALHELLPVLRREYVETGKIRFGFINAGAEDTVYNARFAAHAAFCAGLSGRFWEALDAIAAAHDEWVALDDPQSRLDAIAVRAGADAEQQRACRQRGRMLAMLAWDKERADAAQLTAIPTLLIGDQRLTGDLSPAAVRRAIDKALAAKP